MIIEDVFTWFETDLDITNDQQKISDVYLKKEISSPNQLFIRT